MESQDRSIYATLDGAPDKTLLAQQFAAHGWHIRKAGWDAFEMRHACAELILEAQSPVLLHGNLCCIGDSEEILADMLRILQSAGQAYTVEIYDDNAQTLIASHCWPQTL